MSADLPLNRPRRVVVVTFDHWPLHSLGCYGNEWVDTPTWDELATTGFVFDRHVASLTGLSDVGPAAVSADWLQSVLENGGRVIVLREAEARPLTDLPTGCEVHLAPQGVTPPESPHDLPFAKLLATADPFVTAPLDRPTLLWLHSAGVSFDSVPPADLWEHYADEFSADDFDWEQHDPDVIARHPAIRAVYVTMLDFLLGELWKRLKTQPESQLFSCSALAGLPWLDVSRRQGVHSGFSAPELLAPWVVWEKAATTAEENVNWVPGRSSALVQPTDLGPTMLHWLGLKDGSSHSGGHVWPLILGEVKRLRTHVLTRDASSAAVAVWTEQDQTLFPAGLTGETTDLAAVQHYLQPEDPWNVFDAASTSEERIQQVVALAKDLSAT
ncbi:hypothetical protein GC163_14590 [bacterium]|nr:hypothetical protein [bacterium]